MHNITVHKGNENRNHLKIFPSFLWKWLLLRTQISTNVDKNVG
jgi:hypothetical protein